MKKILLLFLLFCTTSTLLAQTFTFDGIKYNITSTTEPRTVEVGQNGFVQGASPQTYFAGVAYLRATVTHNGLSYAVTRIGDNAFYRCVNLTGVDIPNSILSIGFLAFSECTNLKTVTIPDSVTDLGSSVFSESGLESIIIPNSITFIDSSTFLNCRKLVSATLPNTITSIDRSAFQNCTALKNIDLPSSLTRINPYAFTNSGLLSITIPEGITGIEVEAFQGCSSLKSAVLPASLTVLKRSVFKNCPSLKSLTLNNPVPISISNNNFDYITADDGKEIYSIILKVPVGTISQYKIAPVWEGFIITQQRAIGTIFTVDGINYTVADYTTSPTEVNVHNNPTFAGAANIPAEMNIERQSFKVVGITSGAFANNTTITSVSIPDSVKGIGGGFFGQPSAFEHCTGLTSVTLGSGLENIGQGAFAYCTALTTVTSRMQTPLAINPTVFLDVPLANITLRVPAGKIPTYEAASVWTDFGTIASPQVGDTFSVNNINYAITAISPALTAAVASNDTVTGVVDLPASVTHNGDTFAVTGIATDAFKNASITAITIPSTITSIADGAFTNCTALTAVTVNNTVPVAITAAVFTGTTISTATLTVPFGTAAAYEATAVWTDFTIVAPIPAPVVGQTFNFDGINYVVTKATAPYEVAVGSNIYIAVNPVSIPASVWNAGSSFAVTSIADNAFNARLNIVSTTLTNVFSFTIPNSVKVIGAYAFNGCAFSSFTIPNSVVSIGTFAFANTNLLSIEIPNSVVSINRFAFANCIYLKSVHIPSSITSIGDYAFYGCNALKSVTVNWTAPLAINAIVFDRVNLSNSTLHVPAGSVAAYEAAAVWTDFNPIQEIVPAPVFGQLFTVNGINYVVTKATTPYEVAVGTHTGFVGAANIPATVTFAGNSFTVKSISYLAFNENESLTAVTIPNTVTQISDEAFFGCVNLTTATIGTGVTSIGANAFGSCKLTTIDIPSSVVSIGELAFQTNATLSSVKVNWANPITIGADVFSNIVLATVILYVPAGKVADYKASAVWQNFSPIREHGATAVTPTFAAVAPVCSGATIAALPITSVNAISGTWSPAINNTATTTYTFTPTAGQDATTATLEIVVNAIPTAPTASAQNITTATTVGNLVPAPSAAINWYDAPLGGTALATTTALATGTYYVSETNANGCESARTSVAVTVNTVVLPALGDTFAFEGINYIVTKATAPYEVAVGNNSTFVGAANIPTTATNRGNSFGVTTIENSAFLTSTITSVTIPNSVTSIGASAFATCSNLTSVTIPNSVTNIGFSAFFNCSSLTSIIIPDSVTRIGSSAFRDCSSLTAITIPNSVTSIEGATFEGCSGLVSITIPNSVTSIGSSAFHGCINLTSITIPNSVTSIGSSAFHSCSTLTSISIPNSVTSIGNDAFYSCSRLSSVTVNWDVPLALYSNVFIDVNLNNVILYVPDGTVAAYKSAEVWQNFNPIRVIGTGAAIPTFATIAPVCAGGTIAALPTTSNNSITGTWSPAINNTATTTYTFTPTAGQDATTATLEIVVNALPNAPTVSAQNFTVASTVASLVPAPSATINWYDAAAGGTALATTTALATGTYYVSETNANHCESARTSVAVTVNTVVIPAIGDTFAFEGINYIVTKATAPYEVAVGNNSTFVGVANIPSTATNNGNSFAVSSIAERAFLDSYSLTSVTIPNSVTSIGEFAFGASYYSGLTSVTVSAATPINITENVFYGVSLSNVRLNIPEGSLAAYQAASIWKDFSPISELGSVGSVFTSNGLNYTITSATAPYTCEVANNVSFVGAAGIPASVAFNGKTFAVTSIATNAFQNCNGLTAVTVPNSVTSMGIGAFERCTNLVSVSLPTSLTTISSYAFSYCERLTTINIPSSITTIESNAFRECSGLTAISLPNSITSIGHSAFQLCYNLATVNIPNTLTRLEDYLFESCIAIKSIEIPITVTHIGAYSLKNMGLTAITIPSSVTRIENGALEQNTKLTTLNIPSSVTRIDDLAFSFCTGLRSINVNWTTPVAVMRRVFSFIPIETVVLNVPTGTQADYAAAAVWSEFIITEPTTNVTTPPTAVAQTFCNTASVSNLVATGTNLKWYNVASAGTVLLSTDTVVSGTYYVSQTIASVESARTSVVIVVYPLPAAPTAMAQNFTVASTVANLVPAPSATIKWYDAATGGTALAATTAIATGTYYVSETNANNCESARTSVAVNVNTAINYCRNAVAQPLASPFAAGTVVRWYTVATGGRALTGAPTPSTATVGTRLWYVSSVINGIESARETITVNTVALPLQPSSITGTTSVGVLVGSNNTATYTIAFVADAVSYFWTVPSGVDIVDGQGTNKVTLSFKNTSNQAGTIGNISVTAINANGCTGAARASSALKSAIPVAPSSITMKDATAIDPTKAVTNISTFIGTNKVLTLTATASATASSYLWELAAGMTQLSGGTTNTITVNFAGVNAGITSLYVGVKAVSGAGMSSTDNSSLTPATTSTARLLRLTSTVLTGTPTVAGQIAGLCGGVVYNYTTTAVALANRYLITAPAGSIVRSAANVSNNSNSLSTSDLMFTVTYPAGFVATTALPATLEVRAANGVGASSTSRILQLSNDMPTFKTPTGSAGITTFTRTATQTFTVEEVLGATNYNWTVANGAVIASGQGTNTITVDFAAVPTTSLTNTITVVATNTCGVANKTRTLILRRVTPTAARFAASPIGINTTEIYPNPIVGDFNIDVTATKMGMLEMSIYTLDGVLIRKPRTVALAEGENHITENVANFPTGVYILQLVNTASNAVITKKLIKK